MSDDLLPHPATGELFPSPVPPGTGWPGDPATRESPVARTPGQVRRLAARAALADHDPNPQTRELVGEVCGVHPG